MDYLIDDYDSNKFVIEILSLSVNRWEERTDEFAEFNSAIAGMDCGIAVLGFCAYPLEINLKRLSIRDLNFKIL